MASLSPPHTRMAAAIYSVKRALLQVRRGWRDSRSALRPAPRASERGDFAVVLAEHQSPLWTEEALAEQRLQCGKVENLRVAIRRLHGAVLPADAVFSFWKQVGPPMARRGFVAGRELREGCLIPAIGGGICQLSNALYAVALAANAEIVERHAHSQTVPGSAAAVGRDATVAFNYIDLRFRFDAPVRFEASLNHDTLTVSLWGQTPLVERYLDAPMPRAGRGKRWELLTPTPNSCVQCGQDACFRHVPEANELSAVASRTAFLLLRPNLEFERFVSESRSEGDTLLVPLANRRLAAGRYAYPMAKSAPMRAATALTIRQMIAARWMARREKNAARRARRRGEAEALAATYDQLLRPEETHLVVDQELLPALWRRGTLGGRTFDVFATQMPLAEMQACLDNAAARYPESRTLNDFRISNEESAVEREALNAARRILTPHPELAHRFGARAVLLAAPPTAAVPARSARGRFVVFSGPTIGRKGCYELRAAIRALDVPLIVVGRCLEGADFWQGLDVRLLCAGDTDALTDALADAAVVVQPSLWEARPPRLLLDALTVGIPVVATPGCALGDRDGVTTVPFGDAAALTAAIADSLKKTGKTHAIE